MTDTPEQGMEKAAKGMTNEQVRSELERLNRMPQRTLGQEEARKTLENEFGKRLSGQR